MEIQITQPKLIGLAERQAQGQEVYVESMEKSVLAKFKEIEPWIRPGTILDICAGAGPLTSILAEKLSGSRLVAVDFSDDMFQRMKKRFAGRGNIEVVKADATEFVYDKPFNTALFVSGLHEVFSGNGFDHGVVVQTLHNVVNNPKFVKGGRVIIRDGVMPEPETLFVKPLNYFAYKRFLMFVNGYGATKKVDFTFGKIRENRFDGTSLPTFGEVDRNDLMIRINSQDANEMLSKYHYEEKNLTVELSEKFGIWTLKEYQNVFKMFGLKVVHAESYLLPYLRDTHYSRDFAIYRLNENGKLISAPYPDSTMLLVGEKQ